MPKQSIDKSRRVRVHWNLHKHCYSLQHYIPGVGWRLERHAQALWLKNPAFKVYEAGRQRVLKEQRKTVHAYVLGIHSYHPMASDKQRRYPQHAMGCPITYNPYKDTTFVAATDRTPIESGQFEMLMLTFVKPSDGPARPKIVGYSSSALAPVSRWFPYASEYSGT